MATAHPLAIDTSASALQMAEIIFGDGIQIVSATYTGAATASGVFSGANTTMPGVVPSDSGVILSTGAAREITNSGGSTDTNLIGGTGTSNHTDGNSDLTGLAQLDTYDAAILAAEFIPAGDYLTMSVVFLSDEYLEYVNDALNDVFGIRVNGQFVPAAVSDSGRITINDLNPTDTPALYLNNPADTDPFNTEMDGFTVTLSFKVPVNPGVVNTIKIGIADGGDAVLESNVLIAASSVQPVTLAHDDAVTIPTGHTRIIDVLANDEDLGNSGLTITRILGVYIATGQTVVTPTGYVVTLNPDGRLTVMNPGPPGSEIMLTYTVVDGNGNMDVGYVTITTPPLDGIVQGTGGGDLIDHTYVGDPQGDRIDNNDAIGVQGTVGQDDYVIAGGGDDTIHSGAGNDTLSGGEGDDTLFGGEGNESLTGGDGADVIYGGAGTNVIFGGAGNDVIHIGGSGDTVTGGGDRDTFFVDRLPGGAVIDGSETGDDYDVLDFTTWGSDRIRVIYDPENAENGTVHFLDTDGNVIDTLTFFNIEHVVPCFTPGSLVLTERGYIAVESILPGERVLTRDGGCKAVEWVGRRDLSLAEMQASPQFAAVKIAAGSLGQGLPLRDMVVSPQHRMLITDPRAELLFGEHEVLVAALHLVGRPGITRMAPQPVSYIHLLFSGHEIINVDGSWTESYQPGAASLPPAADPQRAELLSLFPDLAQGRFFAPARITLKRHEALLLSAG